MLIMHEHCRLVVPHVHCIRHILLFNNNWHEVSWSYTCSSLSSQKIIRSFWISRKKCSCLFIFYYYYFEMASLALALMKCLCASYLNSQLLKLGYFCPFSLASSLSKVLVDILFETLFMVLSSTISRTCSPLYVECINVVYWIFFALLLVLLF